MREKRNIKRTVEEFKGNFSGVPRFGEREECPIRLRLFILFYLAMRAEWGIFSSLTRFFKSKFNFYWKYLKNLLLYTNPKKNQSKQIWPKWAPTSHTCPVPWYQLLLTIPGLYTPGLHSTERRTAVGRQNCSVLRQALGPLPTGGAWWAPAIYILSCLPSGV